MCKSDIFLTCQDQLMSGFCLNQTLLCFVIPDEIVRYESLNKKLLTVIKVLLSFVVKCSLSFALHRGSHVALRNISQISWLQLTPRCDIIIIKNTPVPPPPNLLQYVA